MKKSLTLALFLLLSCMSLLLSGCGSSGARFTVAGSITDTGGKGIEGITVTMGSETSVTDSTGRYGFTSVKDGDYTIVPSGEGYIFNPTSRSVRVEEDNVFDLNFTVNWTPRSSGTTSDLAGATFSGATYLIVGASGTILFSTDTVTWTAQTSGVSANLNGTVYGSAFVAVGSGGTILTSSDAVTWTAQTSGTASDLNGVAYGNSLYVAVGSGGTILTSSDAVTWTAQTSGTASDLSGVAYGNSLYVAVGSGGTILTSSDAVTWTA
ncbi:MAG: carboxypeptidase regulatory-like domain-containing protein, partial [Nitrospirales bacterium]|nr:carboxypeptidase regulatory-like domain-containing protein [Nitrospirales bacterium]